MDFPVDPNEFLRLQTIEELAVKKHLPDETVDRITAFARARFDVPICLVTLVEADRQLFLSRQGLDVDQTPRSASFCTHTILASAVFVVPDARKDDRFRDNPLVTGEPFIRFYAGAPLVYRDEIRLGALCLIDRKPRTFSRGEQAELMMLADAVVSIVAARAFGLPEPDLSLALSG
ncbi:MAG TPA: GAF domain-containing protein [Microvirga sp.]|nr:GAF domain-containing protein [Microvirga sp.]